MSSDSYPSALASALTQPQEFIHRSATQRPGPSHPVIRNVTTAQPRLPTGGGGFAPVYAAAGLRRFPSTPEAEVVRAWGRPGVGLGPRARAAVPTGEDESLSPSE